MMSIDVHESAVATRTAAKRARKSARKTAKRARRRAIHTVDAARAVEIHVPDQAKQVAKRAAKKAAKQATAAAGRAAHRKTKRAGRRAVRFTFGALAIGGVVALGFVLARRLLAAPTPAPAYEVPNRAAGVSAAGSDEPAVDGEGRTADVAP
jgi:hypothetical protein